MVWLGGQNGAIGLKVAFCGLLCKLGGRATGDSPQVHWIKAFPLVTRVK